QDARRGDRALQRTWRHLGRAYREFRDGGEGRQARRPGRHQERHQLRRLGMPAGRRSPDAGDGADRGRADAETLARQSSHRADGAGLWTDGAAMTPRAIEVSAILPLGEYVKLRAERRRQIAEIKKNRRLEVGPFATFYFESYETMLHQVNEMLFIEKGGAAQIPDELAAYNPLIPQGGELVATVMFEIDDPLRRARVLATLGGIEHKAFLRVGGATIRGVPEDDQERSREDGKASSVQFMRFAFT